jgi:hypothetical protein
VPQLYLESPSPANDRNDKRPRNRRCGGSPLPPVASTEPHGLSFKKLAAASGCINRASMG